LRVLGQRGVEGVDEVAGVLGEDHDPSTAGCRRGGELSDDGEVRLGVGGRGERARG
jgi:hypothetical protein